MQSWVSKSTARSVTEEPESMQMAAENRRRIMGSSLFGGDSRQYQQNLSKTQPIPSIEEDYAAPVSLPPQSQSSLSTTLPRNSDQNFDYSSFSPSSSSLGGTLPRTEFPDLNFDNEPPSPILNASDLGLKPRQTNYRQNGAHRRLQVQSNQQMRQLRDELNRETERFNHKLRQFSQT